MSDENHKDAKHAGYNWEPSDKCGGHGYAKPAAAGLRSPNGFVGRLGVHGFKVAKGRKWQTRAAARGGNFHLSPFCPTPQFGALVNVTTTERSN
jgi:hypothetical protein